MFNILIVDDEPLIRKSLYEILRIEGYNAHMTENAEDALELLSHTPVDAVITDMKLPSMSGLDLLEAVKKDHPETEVIIITGYGSIETAVEAMKKGAYDYITKPIIDNEIKLLIKRIIDKKSIVDENISLKRKLARTSRSTYDGMTGASEKMQKIYHIIDSVASTHATILITGDSGTGKSLVARAIQRNDKQRLDKPFVEVSCGALSETLLESELFGHMKGSFTGAIKDKEGRFEYAKDGTIFLDEIDAFSPNLQVKLLRVLQDGIFERVGDNMPRKTDARIIVATNRDLREQVEKGEFREDLYYRINVIAIQVPPLRERKEDIELLVDEFMRKYNEKSDKKITGISEEVRKTFLEYNWPGNIRELENAIEGAVIMAKTDVLNLRDIPNAEKFSADAIKPSDGKPLKKILEEPERELILSVLRESNWNRNKAAAALGVNRTTLYNKMKKLDIPFKRPAK